MGFLPEKFLCWPLRAGGITLGALGLIASVAGLFGALDKLDEVVEIFGFEVFSVRSISGMYSWLITIWWMSQQ